VKSQILSWERGQYFEEFNKDNWDVIVDFARVFYGAQSTLFYDEFYSKSGLPFSPVNAEVDKLIEEAMDLEAAKNITEAARKYEAVQRTAIEDHAVLYPIAFQKYVIAHKKGIQNLAPHPLSAFYNGATPRALSRLEWK